MNSQPILINGWAVFADPCFLAQVEELQEKVKKLRLKYPETWMTKDSAKRLAAIVKLALNDIPEDPTRRIYRQGGTLGEEYTHWFRAKFYQQYRLFFRYQLENKVIILGWVNDSSTKRAYDSKTDAYQTFRRMLENGHPPDNWDDLLKSAQAEGSRLEKIMDQP